MADKSQAIGCGKVAAFYLASQRIGLVKLLHEKMEVLRQHPRYHESFPDRK